MNTVVFHPWPSRVGNPDNPDQLRIDLDPQPGTGFDDAVPAPIELRQVLAEAGLTSFIKTSGNRRLHVFAPIERRWEFLDVRHAVIAVARELERRMPEKVTTSWWKEERGARRCSSTSTRRTAIAPSPPPTARAPCRTPRCRRPSPGMNKQVNPKQFTILTVPDRLRTIGDPWESFGAAPGRIETLLEWVAARPRLRTRRTAVPARLPEDAGGAAAGAAVAGEEGGCGGLGRRGRAGPAEPRTRGAVIAQRPPGSQMWAIASDPGRRAGPDLTYRPGIPPRSSNSVTFRPGNRD